METLKVPEKFSSPEEEFKHLREETLARARENAAVPLETHAEKVVEDYKVVSKEKDPRAEAYIMPPGEKEAIVLNLRPETHDAKMEELLGILLARGVKNAFAVLDDLNDPHVDDDFHRFLVQYLLASGGIDGLRDTDPLFKGINMVLYRIAVPRTGGKEEEKLVEFISRMEQFYAGMLSIGDGAGTEPGKNYFTLELALPEGEATVALYAAVPRGKAAVFEKQFLAFYPGAALHEVSDDYNVFVQDGASIGP